MTAGMNLTKTKAVQKLRTANNKLKKAKAIATNVRNVVNKMNAMAQQLNATAKPVPVTERRGMNNRRRRNITATTRGRPRRMAFFTARSW